MDLCNWLLGRSGICFRKVIHLKTYTLINKSGKHIIMVRIVLLIILILFVIWLLRPLLKIKRSSKTKDTLNRILNLGQSDFRRRNNIFIIITATIFMALAFWLLPKLGINFLALLQKIIPILSSLRGILPF